MLKPLCIASVLLLAAPAFAQPIAASKPVTYTIHMTDADLRALTFAMSRVGKSCSPADEDSCRAQILLDDFGKRLVQEVQTQKPATALSGAAPVAH